MRYILGLHSVMDFSGSSNHLVFFADFFTVNQSPSMWTSGMEFLITDSMCLVVWSVFFLYIFVRVIVPERRNKITKHLAKTHEKKRKHSWVELIPHRFHQDFTRSVRQLNPYIDGPSLGVWHWLTRRPSRVITTFVLLGCSFIDFHRVWSKIWVSTQK